MWFLFTVAWRNLWRQRRRSMITASAMAIAVGLCMSVICLNDGTYGKFFDIMVEQQLGHVQVHNPKYPGLQITIYNAYEDGKPAKKMKGRKKGQANVPVDPNDPLIIIHSVDFDGPVHAEWPPRSHKRIFLPPVPGEAERSYAERILAGFMTRAYRRPIRDTDLSGMLSLYDTLRPAANSFESAMRDVLAMVLISPDFLYLIEPRTDSPQPQDLNDFELAARLSYFLWSSMPDERLFQLANAGSLTDHRILANEVRRMIDDSKSNMFVEGQADIDPQKR